MARTRRTTSSTSMGVRSAATRDTRCASSRASVTRARLCPSASARTLAAAWARTATASERASSRRRSTWLAHSARRCAASAEASRINCATRLCSGWRSAKTGASSASSARDRSTGTPAGAGAPGTPWKRNRRRKSPAANVSSVPAGSLETAHAQSPCAHLATTRGHRPSACGKGPPYPRGRPGGLQALGPTPPPMRAGRSTSGGTGSGYPPRR